MPIPAPNRWSIVSLMISMGTKKRRSTLAHANAIQLVRSHSRFQQSALARISPADIRVTTDSWLCQIPRASSFHRSAVMEGSFVELAREQALDPVDLRSHRAGRGTDDVRDLGGFHPFEVRDHHLAVDRL